MSEYKLRAALEMMLGAFCSDGIVNEENRGLKFAAMHQAHEALEEPSVELTDEECLTVMHTVTSELLPEDERIDLAVFLKAYEEKIEGAMALLAGCRAVIAAHEAKKLGDNHE